MSRALLFLSLFLIFVLLLDLPPHPLSVCSGSGTGGINVQCCAREWLLAGAPVPSRSRPRLIRYTATRPRVSHSGGAGLQPHSHVVEDAPPPLLGFHAPSCDREMAA